MQEALGQLPRLPKLLRGMGGRLGGSRLEVPCAKCRILSTREI